VVRGGLHGGFINVIGTAENPYVEIQFGFISICLPKNERQIDCPWIQ